MRLNILAIHNQIQNNLLSELVSCQPIQFNNEAIGLLSIEISKAWGILTEEQILEMNKSASIFADNCGEYIAAKIMEEISWKS